MKTEEFDSARDKFIKDFVKDLKMKEDKEGIILNLMPLHYNGGKNKGVCTIIKKGSESKKYNEQDYPIILKCPEVMKIEQIYVRNLNPNIYYLLIMEESLSNLYFLNKTLHNDGFSLLKIINSPYMEIMGENLLKYFTKQIINLLEFIDRNNLYFKNLSLKHFFVSKKDFLIRLYNFKNIINLDDKEKPIDKTTTKKSSLNKNKIKENIEENELKKKEYYDQIGGIICDLIFDNSDYKNINESPEIIEDKEIELKMRYNKKIKAKNMDDNLKDLLFKLICFEPKYRPNIEEIYRNKWVNENSNLINEIVSNFEKDIIKIISEFAKYDYLNKLEKYFPKNKEKYINDKNININNILEEKPKNVIKPGRFTYKKRIKKKH